MIAYDFAFIIDADPHNEAVEDILVDEPFDDATLILQNGALALSFDRRSETYQDAVMSAYKDIKSTGFPILGFDPDYLVTSAEIARRVEMSRAVISKYEHADRGFPAPIKGVMGKRPMYDWVKVSKWFVHEDMIDSSVYRHALISRIINVGSQVETSIGTSFDLPALVDKALEAA